MFEKQGGGICVYRVIEAPGIVSPTGGQHLPAFKRRLPGQRPLTVVRRGSTSFTIDARLEVVRFHRASIFRVFRAAFQLTPVKPEA